MMGHLSLSFLGGFDVTLDSEPVTRFGADKARALLAFLAIEAAHPHRRAELSAMFWPDLPEKKAAHNLSQTLLRLRRALREREIAGEKENAGCETSPDRPLFLLITPQDVQVNFCGDCELDVARFRDLLAQSAQHLHTAADLCPGCVQRLRQATNLYHGDLLSGMFIPDSLAFEEWRLVQQEGLHEQMLAALTRLAAYHEQRGEWNHVQDLARRQITLEPWREAAHMQLMRALASSGQTAAALGQYETYQRTLADELGIQPTAEVASLYEQIRAGTAQPTAAQPGVGETAWIPNEGERRQVTALVCGRASQGDPEEIQEQMARCERHCESIFQRFGGRRALRQGNACMVYFGYPQAYEDAPRRAVHSALALAASLNGEEPVRMGIHTGLMTVGEKRGRRWQDRDLMGTVLETARECQRLAGAGEVVISEATRRLVQEAFRLLMIEQPALDGREQPGLEGARPAYRVQGENGVQSRLEWLAQTQRLTAFTGRDADLIRLRACHEKLQKGKGQVILIRGEPGIGKSRLVWELQKSVLAGDSITTSRVSPDREVESSTARADHPQSESHLPGESLPQGESHPPALWFTSRCLPYHQNTSLYPIIGLLEQLLGFQAGDNPDVRQERLARMLARYGLNRPSNIWLLSLLLGLPTSAPPPETIKAEQREQMRKVFIALVQKRAAEQPLVLVIEDLHWSDPSTVGWLGQSIASLASVPCLMLLTTRPDFRPPEWRSDKTVQQNLLVVNLHPLPSEQAAAIVSDLSRERRLDEALFQRIVAQADGVPLFIEELTKSLLEQPVLAEGATQPANEIPATLRDSLVARLDHLGLAKETAQWAAVLGREFPFSILQACAPFDEQRLQRDITRLIEVGLVAPAQVNQQAAPYGKAAPYSFGVDEAALERYSFKHALVQEAAYASLLKRTRQVYHRRIAETLEKRFPQMGETRSEILAQHYANAGMQPQAADCWLRAGERVLAQGATLEARIFFDRALEGIEPGDRERRWQALRGREKVMELRGERDAQKMDLEVMLKLAEALDDDARRAYVYLRQTATTARTGDYRTTLELADKARIAARSAGNLTLELNAQAYRAQTLTFLHEMEEAHQVVEEILARMDQITDDSVRGKILATAAHYYVEDSDLASAIPLQSQGIEVARRAGDYQLELVSSANLGMIYIMLGLYPQARATLETGRERAEVFGDQWIQGGNMRHLGFVYWCMGELERARELNEQGLEMLIRAGDLYGQATCHGYLGYILEDIGDFASAAEHLALAYARFAEIGLDVDKIEAQSVAARVALAQGRNVEARQMVLEVWNYLCENGIADFSGPALVCESIADVLEAGEIPGVSLHEVIGMCYHDLIRRAEKISNPEWRQSFLENVVENREIIKRWNTMITNLG